MLRQVSSRRKNVALRTSLASVVRGRGLSIAAMSVTSLIGALAEATVLVLITQIGFALAKSEGQIDLELGPIKVTSAVGVSIIAAMALVVVRGLLQTLNGWQSSKLVAGYLASTRKTFARAFVNASLEAQTQRRVGELQQLLTTFVGRGASVMMDIARGITSAFSLIALVGAAIAVSPLASFGLIATLALLGLFIFPLRRVLRTSARRVANTDIIFATAVSEYSALGNEMQVFGVEAEIASQLDDIIDDNARASQRLSFQGFLFTPFYATVLLMILVGSLTAVKALGLTDLATLGAVVLVMLRSMAYAQLLQGVITSLHSSAPFISDLDERLLALEEACVSKDGLGSNTALPLVATDLSFSYGAEKHALLGLSFSIRPGEIVGIVGPSGSGKSTLVQLLLRLRTPTAGSIEADGIPVSRIAIKSWRENTAFVPQDARLLHGTITDNIRFFRSQYSEQDVREAASLANLHEEILALNLGYQTIIGESGHTLSGGQRQRICIARALLSRPGLLIMDEPTSALDVKSEAKIRDVVEGFRGRRTVVVIAHRLSTVEICDRIMVVKDGLLVAFDSPSELRKSDEFYRESLELSGLTERP